MDTEEDGMATKRHEKAQRGDNFGSERGANQGKNYFNVRTALDQVGTAWNDLGEASADGCR